MEASQNTTVEGSGSGADRRREPRRELDRPVKIHCVETGKFLPGRTRNLSSGGALVQIDHPSLLVPGQRVKVGISWTTQQALLHAGQLVEGIVVRSLGLGGTQSVAVQFDAAQQLATAG